MKRMLAITCAGALLLALTSCSIGQKGNNASQGNESAGSISGASSSVSGDISGGESSSSSEQDSRDVNLYIGMNGTFQEYPLEVDGEVTPETLIQSMAELTGWNLDVVSAVEGNGKVMVSFAKTCALYVGPPEEQKEEFRVLDAGQLDQTILDSIQKTIQEWIGTEDGTAEVYFTDADGGDLVLEGIGVTISAETPYVGFPTQEAK